MEARDSAVRAASVRAATAVGMAVYLAGGGPGQAGQMFAPEQVLHQNKGSFSVVSKPVFAKKYAFRYIQCVSIATRFSLIQAFLIFCICLARFNG